MHRDQARIVRRAADVVALERHRRGQRQVGVTGHRRPERVVHDDRLGPRQRPAQARDVLMVVKRIAAAPVDEPDVRESEVLAVEVERLTRMEQHVGHPREGDERVDGILALRQGRRTDAHGRATDVAERSVPLTESPAR